MQEANQKTPPLRVAIVGLQHLHPEFYTSLFDAVEDAQVTAVAEKRTTLRRAFCERHGVAGYASVETLLKKETPDICALFLPHSAFPDVAERCAGAGCHLLVDKPMATDEQGAKRIVRAAARHHVQLSVPYFYRRDPAMRYIKRLVAAGALGKMIVSGEGRFAAKGPWRYVEGHSGWMLNKAHSGGGPMRNLGVHHLDLFRWFLGDEVVWVSAQTTDIDTETDIEDACHALLRFKGGASISVSASYLLPKHDRRGMDRQIVLTGTRGTVSWTSGVHDDVVVSHQGRDGAPPLYAKRRFKKPDYFDRMGTGYVQDFCRSVRTGQPPEVTGQDGQAVARIVDAIYRAAAMNKSITI